MQPPPATDQGPPAPTPFADRLLTWFDRHGRHGLPWQSPRTPYRVWLSEVMLQQTQVTAVIPYFEVFLARFPTVAALAEAPADEVMRLWAGLGYYARARNLHAAAKAVMAGHGGEFPTTAAVLETLPGVGRSTAAAIAAQAHGERAAILDGNVKRVLARWGGIAGYPGETAVAAKLWRLSEALLPHARLADYTQALMDLGATLCTARRPDCPRCPVAADCVARATGQTETLPGRKPVRARPQRAAWLLIARDEEGRLLLERRPPQGLWGGLWCPPVIDLADAADWRVPLAERYGLALDNAREEAGIDHGFTHFDLHLRPVSGTARPLPEAVREAEDDALRWVAEAALLAGAIGVPTPVLRYAERRQGSLLLGP